MTLFALLACGRAPLDLEAVHAAPGPHAFSSLEWALDDGLAAYAYVPDAEDPAPVILFSNGSGTRAEQYQELLEHLASWGFVVLACDDEQMGTGERAAALLESAQLEADAGAFQADFSRVGAMGTSQGAGSSLNAHLLTQGQEVDIDTVLANALPKPSLWSEEDTLEPSEIDTRLFIQSGARDNIISPTRKNHEWLESTSGTGLVAHLRGAGHLEMGGDGGGHRGLATAWMRAELSGDPDAQSLFVEDGPLLESELWTDLLWVGR